MHKQTNRGNSRETDKNGEKKKGVIFDFNGTLLWDTHLHNLAWDNFLTKYGLHLTDEEKHRRIHGRMNSEILKDIFDNTLTEKEIESFRVEKEYEYQRLCKELDDFTLAKGAIELFDRLKSEKIPFVIATASEIENVEFYISTFKLEKWFRRDHIIYNDGTVKGKPSPDLFLKALDVIKLHGSDVVIFEDSIAGIKAAEAANAGKIVIVNSNDGDYSEYKEKYLIIQSFNELSDNWFNEF
jgi:haloacid dehalogenase superfamily, subfamily IA, variant 3 with third motif having DD or ED